MLLISDETNEENIGKEATDEDINGEGQPADTAPAAQGGQPESGADDSAPAEQADEANEPEQIGEADEADDDAAEPEQADEQDEADDTAEPEQTDAADEATEADEPEQTDEADKATEVDEPEQAHETDESTEVAQAEQLPKPIRVTIEVVPVPAAKQRYSLMETGIVSMVCELCWFVGGSLLVLLVSSLGLDSMRVEYAVTILSFPLTMFAVPYLFLTRRGLSPGSFTGTKGRMGLADALLVCFAAFSLWALVRIPESLWAHFMHNIFGSGIPSFGGLSSYDTFFLVDFVRKCIIPAVFEEYLYRGFVFRSLRGGIGPAAAAAISTLIFILMHADLANVIAPLALGLFNSYLLEKTGSLFPCMISHFIYNLSSTLGNMRLNSRASFLSTADGQLMLSALMVASSLAMLLFTLSLIKRRGRYSGSVAIREYAACNYRPIDLLPYMVIIAMLGMAFII